ncbi:D-alanine--D-serine ligase VanG [Paenibacillus beijingensis]|uniref:D-alanine--D-alanine ligase n=1 Tax=Paenibacillus beijingensis TaxID=1126833 RepID=A0A0D5NDN8_9BACL|nr:D-alanine--D-serine ligase VanG [Paenibacillus beijingensis]AJY73509.1 D-alanine--D-alanine ligase [Paenibacillus beijingensis]
MKKLTIGVLFGGCSTEHEVSLSSSAAVLNHLNLNREKYDIVMIGITRDGQWYRYEGEVDRIQEDSWSLHPSCTPVLLSPNRAMKGLIELVGTEYRFTPLDAVFPVLHGKNGEDGTMQGLLELSGIPFVGCDTLSSAICMDKAIAKTLVAAAGIGVPPFITVTAGDPVFETVAAAEKLGFPLYVKPAKSGSSIGITKVYNKQELMAGIEAAHLHDSKVVIERHVDGFELGCAVLGNTPYLVMGEMDEIELAGEFFDHEEKYSLSTASIHLPARIDPNKAKEATEMALRIYRALGCSGLARVDLFLTKDGTLLFNEVNTIPGFTAKSRYPSMMREAGMNFPELLDRLVAAAVQEVRA